MQQALQHYPEGAGSEALLEKALTTVKDRVASLLKIQPSDQLIAGQIHLIRPTGSSKYDNCGLLKVSILNFLQLNILLIYLFTVL